MRVTFGLRICYIEERENSMKELASKTPAGCQTLVIVVSQLYTILFSFSLKNLHEICKCRIILM